MMEDGKKEHPTLVLELPNGIVIKLYQPISENYLKELIEEYMVQRKLVIKTNC